MTAARQQIRQEIIEKAITKAVDGGWLPDFGHHNQFVSKNAVSFIVDGSDIIFSLDKGWVSATSSKWMYRPEELIFTPRFAKVLWPDGACTCGCTHAPGEVMAIQPDDDTLHYPSGMGWQYHLQNMVISDNPTEYLGEHLDG